MEIKDRKYISIYNQLLKACDTVYHNAAVAAGLSDCAFWILYSVQDADYVCTQSEICDNSSLPRQTVNSALKKLEKDGYLTLQRISGSVSKSIHLTEAGTALVQQHLVPVMEAEQQVCESFSDEEIKQFLTTFQHLVDRLGTEIGRNCKEAG